MQYDDIRMNEHNMLLLCVVRQSPDEQCWQQTALLSCIQVASECMEVI